MKDVTRAFGLACRDMFYPWVWWLSFKPFLISGVIWFSILWFAWTPLLDFTRGLVTDSWLTSWIGSTVSLIGWGPMRAMISPYLAALVIMPLIIVTQLCIVSFSTIPRVVRRLERQKPYLGLRRANEGSFFGSIKNALLAISMALFLFCITFPVWWIPPLFSIIPPLIWGWLTAKMMIYDILEEHAEVAELEKIFLDHRLSLILIGIMTGLLGAVPTFFWLSSVFIFILFPIVSLLMMWIYSLLFIFAALWFGHFLLFALRVDRQLKGESL